MIASFRSVAVTAAACFALAACRAEPHQPPTAAAASEVVEGHEVLLPAGDPCRPVLGRLALGLAEGAVGLENAERVVVTATAEDYYRHYAVAVDGRAFEAEGRSFANDYFFDLTLDNDSSFGCWLIGAKLARDFEAGAGPEERALPGELAEVPKVSVPEGDACGRTVALLAAGASLSAMGPTRDFSTDVKLVSETETRSYEVHVDGEAFVVDGHTIPNDAEFRFLLDNDSASKCLPLRLN